MNRVTQKKATWIIIHILIWAVLLALPVYSAGRFSMGSNFLLTYYAFITINALIFYTNYLVLVPWLFFQKKKYRYYVAAAIFVFCFYFISDYANEKVFSYISINNNPEQLNLAQNQGRRLRAPGMFLPRFIVALPKANLIGYMSSSLFMVFISLGLRVFERQSKIEKMQENMEKAKLSAELAFLKNQISPHFFFNTLNNIYSLIGINAEDSQKAVLKLSKLMRYLLYESEHGNVQLSNEIDFMKNYIDLMKLRMSEKVSLNIGFPKRYDDVFIPPLLFIPFIENAFKHGISNRSKSFIHIALASSEKIMEFTCTNSVAKGGTADKQPGIGLENVTKRLNLLFPRKHDLVISRDNDKFEVRLTIKFH